MAKKKQKEPDIVRYCKDCIHSEPNMKFENLSVNGEPTLLSCPYQEWRMLITTTEVCDKYEDNLEPTVTEEVIEQSTATSSSNWLDW